LDVSLNTIGDSVGYTKEQIDFAVESLRQQGITTQSAQKSLLRMARANISWAEASKLAAIAQGSAVVAGMDSSAAFTRLVTGIQKMEPELLDELGITLRRNDAYKKLANELGINVLQLNDQQRQQAILNEIYRQSESVLGVYDAAMDTAGKRQGSLTRKTEEFKLIIGELLIPIREIEIGIKEAFVANATDVAKGLASWGELLKVVIDSLGKQKEAQDATNEGLLHAIGLLKEGRTFWDQLGEGVFNFGRLVVTGFIAMDNAVQVVYERILRVGQLTFAALSEAVAGNFDNAKQIAEAALSSFDNVGGDIMQRFEQDFTDLLLSSEVMRSNWEDLGKVAEVSLERQSDGVQQVTEDLDAMKEALEDRIKIVEGLGRIFDRFSKAVRKAESDFIKNTQRANAQFEKAQTMLFKEQAKERSELNEEISKRRAKLEQETGDRIKNEQKKLHQDLLRAQQDFELSRIQATRRFQVQDRRLRADGDVLALMQLREDFQLQQQESKENFGKDQDRRRQDNTEREKEIKDDAAKRMLEFDKEAAERREALKADQTKQLEDMRVAHKEQLTQIEEAFQEQTRAAVEARNQQLEDYGRSLARQGELTEEGFGEIVDITGQIFGDRGSMDLIMQGWSARTETTYGNLIRDLRSELSKLEEDVNDAVSSSGVTGLGRPNDPTARGFLPGRRRMPMRQGGSGVVVGPATFTVEPGVKEAVSFAPLPAQGSSFDVNVNMGGGFDIRGAENASSGMVDQALLEMTETFEAAVTRMMRRRS